ncbi:class II aldolase/adducin family protein [Naasia aerilata]|uniref:ABC transmembrane type-1 domain-containing protein n=1 Tax=Naasia aerilata TaxID=1162966 RepID=A0ABM8GBS5_9MICO|nr:class II aldolase/adducin family protein [Naasia aerilata]BDZ45690.1 hypothetical protein GCM10025866_15990 [Naasia aerilata]
MTDDADALIRAARHLAARGLSPGSSGNLSVRMGDRMLITPTGSSLSRVESKDLAEVPLGDGSATHGSPSKEYPLHLAVYRQRPGANAVVHLHSPYATAIACLPPDGGLAPLPPLTPYRLMRLGDVPVAPFAAPGSRALADGVESRAKDSPVILLAQHGSVVAGDTVDSAVDLAEELETAAQLTLLLADRAPRLLSPPTSPLSDRPPDHTCLPAEGPPRRVQPRAAETSHHPSSPRLRLAVPALAGRPPEGDAPLRRAVRRDLDGGPGLLAPPARARHRCRHVGERRRSGALADRPRAGRPRAGGSGGDAPSNSDGEPPAELLGVARLVAHHAADTGRAITATKTTGEIVATVSADSNRLGAMFDILARLIGSIVAWLVIAGILFTSSFELGLLVLLGVPASSLLLAVLVRPLARRQLEQRAQFGGLATLGADAVAGLRVLRGVGGEDEFVARYRSRSQQVRRAGVRVASVASYLDGAQVLIPGLFLTGVMLYGAELVLAGRATAGDLVALYGFAAFLVLPIRTGVEALGVFSRGMVGVRRILEVLAVEPAVRDRPQPQPAPPPAPSCMTSPRA